MVLVKDIGEQGLLKILHQFCPPDIVGDDALSAQHNDKQVKDSQIICSLGLFTGS